ncbi:hypothetical protein KFL_003460120 [Klebsormidium nitens]|uniref:Uncharacterized protein n=1 Tax=Klebsormidium nitens TaxID=105231 RepID=A0A1Y1IBJ8_KLENI|nr:hypothetical protein KFL_003460120 [Klebsormidium nitens]|eukprot:GAQ87342.1 hypothetical protein KFL_003460120 [Klebsormidium nitens]
MAPFSWAAARDMAVMTSAVVLAACHLFFCFIAAARSAHLAQPPGGRAPGCGWGGCVSLPLGPNEAVDVPREKYTADASLLEQVTVNFVVTILVATAGSLLVAWTH